MPHTVGLPPVVGVRLRPGPARDPRERRPLPGQEIAHPAGSRGSSSAERDAAGYRQATRGWEADRDVLQRRVEQLDQAGVLQDVPHRDEAGSREQGLCGVSPSAPGTPSLLAALRFGVRTAGGGPAGTVRNGPVACGATGDLILGSGHRSSAAGRTERGKRPVDCVNVNVSGFRSD